MSKMATHQIQWYPGHMHKAGKDITTMLKKVDVCIELLDARIPFSSENPMLASLRGRKPCLKVLSKSDLADAQLNTLWQQHYESDQQTKVLVADIRKAQAISRIPARCWQLYNENAGSKSIITAMVMGIPNVGKSTLINGLAGSNVAKTGDQPALTKVQQVIEIEPGFVLLDTPGMLWPKVENRNSGYRLAVTGAIRDTAISHRDIAEFAADYFMRMHPHRLMERYHLEKLPDNSAALLEQAGRRMGCLVKGGQVDMDRAAKALLADARAGRLGRFTLETPAMMRQELIEVHLAGEERAKRALKRKRERKCERKRKWKESAS
ncbi:ribosome biogenesis GTPase YlqF [Candidatus Spongiihabitans sp.]|uniref:ribosome biogenesis GTPase YlqF n=1 Tax=Candidatus Spongiihabitans sp. TaxID=3101308 RepID=UPI003C7AC8F9